MLEIIICDDEKALRKNLRKIIATELDLCGIAYHIMEYSSGEELLQELHVYDYQILFLDIEMKHLNGIETAKKLRAMHSTAQIIFVTSYQDFVFQGYEVRALNYIMKPYQAGKITEVLHTALKELDYTAQKYFVVQKKDGDIRLPLSSIKYFASERRIIHVFTIDASYTFYGRLNELSSQLNTTFVRIHNRYLVNLKYLQSIQSNTVLVDGEELPVSRSCKADLEIAFAKYILC